MKNVYSKFSHAYARVSSLFQAGLVQRLKTAGFCSHPMHSRTRISRYFRIIIIIQFGFSGKLLYAQPESCGDDSRVEIGECDELGDGEAFVISGTRYYENTNPIFTSIERLVIVTKSGDLSAVSSTSVTFKIGFSVERGGKLQASISDNLGEGYGKLNVHKNTSDSFPEENSIELYPNPFSDKIIISINLVRQEVIKIEIFDILGRQVKALASNYGGINKKIVTWNGLNDENIQVTNGVYFVHFTIGNYVVTRKIVYNPN